MDVLVNQSLGIVLFKIEDTIGDEEFELSKLSYTFNPPQIKKLCITKTFLRNTILVKSI